MKDKILRTDGNQLIDISQIEAIGDVKFPADIEVRVFRIYMKSGNCLDVKANRKELVSRWDSILHEKVGKRAITLTNETTRWDSILHEMDADGGNTIKGTVK